MFKQCFFIKLAISRGGKDLSGFLELFFLPNLSFDSILLVYCP